jgi:hypothetical protein
MSKIEAEWLEMLVKRGGNPQYTLSTPKKDERRWQLAVAFFCPVSVRTFYASPDA